MITFSHNHTWFFIVFLFVLLPTYAIFYTRCIIFMLGMDCEECCHQCSNCFWIVLWKWYWFEIVWIHRCLTFYCVSTCRRRSRQMAKLFSHCHDNDLNESCLNKLYHFTWPIALYLTFNLYPIAQYIFVMAFVLMYLHYKGRHHNHAWLVCF